MDQGEFRKPSEKEEEYFARIEFEKRKKAAEERARVMLQAERERLKETHWMRCPKCGMELVEVVFQSVTVDKCTACGGLYLDRGEIDAILKESHSILSGFRSIFGGGA